MNKKFILFLLGSLFLTYAKADTTKEDMMKRMTIFQDCRLKSYSILMILALSLSMILIESCSTSKKLQRPDALPGIEITFTGEQVADTVYVTISPIPTDTTLYVKEYVEAMENGQTKAYPVKDNKVHIVPDSVPSIYKIVCDYYSLPSYFMRSHDHLDMTINSLGPANYKVTGGIYSQEIPFADQFYELRRKLWKFSRNNLDEHELDSLTLRMNSLLDRIMAVSDPETATRIVPLLDSDFALYAFNRLPEGSENTLYYTYSCAITNSALLTDNQQKTLEQYLESSAPMPEIKVNSLDGQVFDISTLRGKWVVVDFWASWCGPCKRGFEKMKKIYSENPDKVEVVAIDCGDHEEVWRTTVKELELPWINLLAPAPESNNGTVAGFPVTAYPTKIIIDPTGALCDYTVGEVEEFYEKLEKLLKNYHASE